MLKIRVSLIVDLAQAKDEKSITNFVKVISQIFSTTLFSDHRNWITEIIIFLALIFNNILELEEDT